MKKFNQILLPILVVLLGVEISAQEKVTAGSAAKQESLYLYNMPTAGTLKRGAYDVQGWFFGGGGSMASINVGMSNQLSFGISYGAGNLVGSGNPTWNKRPGVMVRFRVIDEEIGSPAITIGFESQGRGNYLESADRFERKSPGLFAVASKNFEFLGYLTFHGGFNYSLENNDDKSMNFFLGVEKTVGKELTLYAQYDAGLNDSSVGALGKGNGFLDAGLRWGVGSGMTIELNLSNLSDNFKSNNTAVSRSVRLEYVSSF